MQTTDTTVAAGGVSGEYSAATEALVILRIRSPIGGCMAVCRLTCSVSFLMESCIDFVQ
jgi:hypothetical protein